MNALPKTGTWRSFTDTELERLGVPFATMEGFMKCVLKGFCDDKTFYPRQEREPDGTL